jgi:hypothetical protein
MTSPLFRAFSIAALLLLLPACRAINDDPPVPPPK